MPLLRALTIDVWGGCTLIVLMLSLTRVGVKQGELGTKSASFPHRREKSRSDSLTLLLKKDVHVVSLTPLANKRGQERH